MGFLKFLKRDKSKEPELDLGGMEDLDMPPLPPDLGKEDFGSAEKELPELPELPEMPEDKELSPELEVSSEKLTSELKIPSLPELPKMEEPIEPKAPHVPRPLFGMRKPRPLFGAPQPEEQKPKVDMPQPKQAEVPHRYAPEIKPYERVERAAVREERAVLRHKEAKEPIFIRVDRFRDILTGTVTIKNNLKTAGQSVVKLSEIDADRDKVLEKWSNVMSDLQKKLIFIDKTLFKR